VAEGADALRKSWLQALAHERRASPHTLRAYGDDVTRFIGFQAGHTGGAVTQKTLTKLTPADIRAFITARRQEGLGPGGVQRALAAVRSFYKFLAKEGVLENAAPFHPHAAGSPFVAATAVGRRCRARDCRGRYA